MELHQGSYDTFIFTVKDTKLKKIIIDILNEFKFGTKNLPDAMEWHCSYFWEHALSQEDILHSKYIYNVLDNQIAIPILLKRNINEYRELAEIIIKVLLKKE